MALSTRQGLIDYCLRRLGHPVIEINVDDDQISDRIDDGLQFFQEYHFDGTERTYVKHEITGSTITLTTSVGTNFNLGETITGGTSSAQAEVKQTTATTVVIEKPKEGTGVFEAAETITGTDTGTTATVQSYSAGNIENGYVPISNSVLSIVRLFNFGGASTTGAGNPNNLFDLQYQFRLNDMYNLLSADMTYYSMVQTHLSMLDQLLVSARQIRWNRKTDRLYIDTDWDQTFDIGDYIVAEAYAVLDPATYTEVYDDMFLKKYCTALIKRQWGENMKKFGGITLPGGVTLNGDQVYQEAFAEVSQIEEEAQMKYELPPSLMIG